MGSVYLYLVFSTQAMQAFSQLISSSFRFRTYLLSKLPAAFFCGIRIKSYNDHTCTTSVRYSWFTKNPFRSTYFAALSMAAEMSTGILAMGHLYGKKPPVSMLVISQEAHFLKKAIGYTLFTCTAGDEIAAAIQKAIETGVGQQITIAAHGENESGETVAEFLFTWSFKRKTTLKPKI